MCPTGKKSMIPLPASRHDGCALSAAIESGFPAPLRQCHLLLRYQICPLVTASSREHGPPSSTARTTQPRRLSQPKRKLYLSCASVCTGKRMALPAQNHAKSLKGMVGVPGIEPGTSSMSTRRSPAELYALTHSGSGPAGGFRGRARSGKCPADPPEAGEVPLSSAFFKTSHAGKWAGPAESLERPQTRQKPRLKPRGPKRREWNQPLPPGGAGGRAWRGCGRPGASGPGSSAPRRQSR